MNIIKEVRIKSFEELHLALKSYKKTNLWLFRGHSDPSWELIPKAGRNPYNEFDDSQSFKSWKRRAVEFLNGTYDNWDLLGIAQHRISY
ncbi:FRG domain-containing protein [Peribacillus butanolivorans]|uniref:FRG domain-containing protein n=1 Tax=Peribacillus butanolivorans TaxID=421767 RepID=UPI0036827C9D